MSKTPSTKKAASATTSDKKVTGTGASEPSKNSAPEKAPAKAAPAVVAEVTAQASKTASQTVDATTSSQGKVNPKGNESAPAVKLSTEDIATRAYFLWESEGYHHGCDNEHWFRAEEQLRNEISSRLKRPRPQTHQ